MQIAIYGNYGVKLTLNEYTPTIKNHLGCLHLLNIAVVRYAEYSRLKMGQEQSRGQGTITRMGAERLR